MRYLFFYKKCPFFHKKYENTRKEANFFETFAGKYCMSLRFYRIISKRKNSGRLVASANRVDVFFSFK
ncbi:hypothetical protein COK05_03350 [Bacillus cereus]|uniref:Uncharacterized protein n=1 Tax=Bacillus cereus TaxID=1396 RepID=A0A2C1M6J6_BACCE|nr:hypothetical protein [Bacillus cereus]PEN00181.1 hypothetical protein CN621_15795 [Bacillus wiedmannii]PFQ52246.1 hypothetical protein COK05_03350 [Bacillus cereus]PGA00566.1 hypothetical protein COL83_00660 [Bacillus wiedmannii]PGU12926.1 hypothetical protein COD21_04460 [Bacillus cereus]